MIGKLHYDDSFDRLSAYVLQQQGKLAEVLAVNGVRVSSPEEMAADFAFQRSLRPDVTMAVEHVSLAWPPSETEKLTNEVMTQAAIRYMQERGVDPEQTQWVVARHYDEDHPHCHLLLNRVTNDGGLIPDKFSKEDSLAACRQVEAEMGFVDAKKLGAAQQLAKAGEPGQPVEKLHRLQMKALVTQALEKHLSAATTMAGLQEALRTEGIGLKVILQKDQSQGAVFTAEAYPGLHMKGSEIDRQYGAQELFKTLEAQEKQAREMQLRALLLTALEKQVPKVTSVAELQANLVAEGITARPLWKTDGQLQEIRFKAAVFPELELTGAALGPQFEARALSQTLADQAVVKQAAEQREAEELRKLIPAQEQQLVQLREASRQAEKQGLYGEVAEITHSKLPLAAAQLVAYKEQAQATESGRLVLAALAEEREAVRQQVQTEGKRVLRLPLEEEQGSIRSWLAYTERVQQRGFEILEVKGQPAELLHIKSGEKFDLALMQPGGVDAPSLRQQVAKELNEQEAARRRAEQMLVDVLAAHRFTSDSELNQQLKEHAYKQLIQPDGQVWLQHEPSGRQFALAELRPNGQQPEAQFKAAMAWRQAELMRGQLEVGPGSDGLAAERAKQFQRTLEAAGAQVIIGAGASMAGKVVLEYRYEWNGVQLEAVNQALRQVQAAPGTLVREQNQGFHQPESQWPVRKGEYGRATLIIPDEAFMGELVKEITRKVEDKGAWVNEVRTQRNGAVELDLGYQTQRTDIPALSGMLDKWKSTINLEVQETPYAHRVREEICRPEVEVLPVPGKAITLLSPTQDKEYERD